MGKSVTDQAFGAVTFVDYGPCAIDYKNAFALLYIGLGIKVLAVVTRESKL